MCTCGNKITASGCNKYTIRTEKKKYTISAYPGSAKRWRKATITIPVAVDILTDPRFKYPLDIFMSLNGNPTDWEEIGWVQDDTNGTLNTSAYAEVQGTLRFKYYA